MGLLRLILALSVVISHVGGLWGYNSVDGNLAVQSFYVISGFYMSLILGRKYTLDRAGILHFYKNRLIRLAPTYWLLLVSYIGIALLIGRTFYLSNEQYWSWFQLAPIEDLFAVGFSNLFVFGQDILMYRAVGPTGALYWTAHQGQEMLPAGRLLLLTPAWSIAIELWFYLVAPFLAIRSWKFLLGACVVSLCVRLGLADSGYSGDPWNFRFFPSEILLFMSGMLINRFYFTYREHFKERWGNLAMVILFPAILGVGFIPLEHDMKYWAILALTGLSLPFIFARTKSNRWDRLIGDCSYPLYLCHWVVQIALGEFASELGEYQGLSVVLVSLVVAFGLNRLVEQPIERFRQRGLALR